MYHQAYTRQGTIQKVGRCVISKAFLRPMYWILAGNDAISGVVVKRLLVCNSCFLFVAGDQVVAGIKVEVCRAHSRQWSRQGTWIPYTSAQPPASIIFSAGADLTLCAKYFTMQAVPLEVTDDLAIEVDLVQMTTAVVQTVDPATIG